MIISIRNVLNEHEGTSDLQERVNHILTKQIFGIGITELTTLMARRTVYCSMTANDPFLYVLSLTMKKATLYGDGGSKESYAYPLIHDNFEKEFGNMKFDVIIGNPPYQLETGGDDRPPSSARAIYHLFIDKAIELNPKYITMIIPSRWMGGNAGGVPIDWVDKMVNDKRIKEIHDFIDSKDCFTNVKIRGGVNYFLWDKYYSGKCSFYQHSEGKEIKFNKDYLNTKTQEL